MRLVDDAHLLWRRWSTRIAAAQAGLVLFWTGLPDDWRAAVPGWVLAVVVGLFALTFISAQVAALKVEAADAETADTGFSVFQIPSVTIFPVGRSVPMTTF